jgi:hypothetical protein
LKGSAHEGFPSTTELLISVCTTALLPAIKPELGYHLKIALKLSPFMALKIKPGLWLSGENNVKNKLSGLTENRSSYHDYHRPR